MKKILIPTLVYLLFVFIYLGYSYIENSNYLFQQVWDIGHYVDISETGYKVYPCTPGVEYPTGEICGNAGWYPFWPLLIKIVRPLAGGSSSAAFSVLAYVLTFFSFQLFYFFVNRGYGQKPALVSLVAFALSPASFYLLTGFPYALLMTLFLAYLALLYCHSGLRRSVALIILAIAISMTYPTGVLFAIVPVLKYIFDNKPDNQKINWSHYLFDLAKFSVPFIFGVLLLWGYFYFRFDDFLLQIHFQEKYQRTWAIPFYVIFHSLRHYPIFSPENAVILWYGLAFILFLPYKIPKELWIFGLILYLFSLTTGTTMSIYRHYLICFPVYFIIGISDRPLWLKLLLIAAGLILALKILFPIYIGGNLI